MASRTIYTSTITVPVYASWVCEKCGEVNFATGAIVCRRESSTSSWRTSKHEEARANASNRAHAEWAERAYRIIKDPNNNGSAMFNNFFLQNTNCTKCGKKPRWNKNPKFMSIAGLVLAGAFLGVVGVFMEPGSIATWLLLCGCLGFIAWSFARETLHKKTMTELPQQYTPIIGSLNRELIEYADSRNERILSPEEAINKASKYAAVISSNAETASVSIADQGKYSDKEFDNKKLQPRFCRKCGSELAEESIFCHKCGTKIEAEDAK